MSFFTSFSVYCRNCQHSNRPDPSPSKAVEMVLQGKFKSCRHCGAEFKTILVPRRPIVARMLAKTKKSRIVKIVDYSGIVGPNAVGVP